LVEYLMTHSERISAIRECRETESEQRRFLAEGIASFYMDAAPTRSVAFGIQIEALHRSPTVSASSTPGVPAEQERREPLICEDERNNAEAARSVAKLPSVRMKFWT
jgi:hypothetical protein